jgi:DNA-binding transcriptional MerR regulator
MYETNGKLAELFMLHKVIKGENLHQNPNTMDTYNLKPENMRAPEHLNEKEIRQSLDELDAKIKVLHGRAHATTADSQHTYHEHIAALEAKRALIAQKLDNTSGASEGTWQDIKNSLEELTEGIKKLF